MDTIGFFALATEGDLRDESLCLVSNPPDGMGINYYRLALGDPAKKYFPENARIALQEDHPGIRLAGILGNLCGFLIVSAAAKEVIEVYCNNILIEYLSFILFNHKNRVHSSDYFFVNPLKGFDCVSNEHSRIKYDKEGEVVLIEELVLDRAKLRNAPHLFRVDKDPSIYVVSATLLDAWNACDITNVMTTPMRIAG